MRVKYTNAELRKILLEHWKQKIKAMFRKYFTCSFENKFCETCKEEAVCKRILEKPWVGKI